MTERNVANAVRSVARAAVAAGLVGATLAIVVTLVMRWLQEVGPLAIGAVIGLAIPGGVLILLVAPFAAGVAGGVAGGRSLAALGSVGGFLAGGVIGLAVTGSTAALSPRDAVLYVACFGTVIVIGHFIGVALRQPVLGR